MILIKKVLLILFVLASFTASAQWTIINGNQRFAKGLGIPTKDTFNTYTLADTSQIVLRPQDSSLYVHYKGRWQKIGGGTGSVGNLQQVTDLGNTTTNAIKINSNTYNNIGVNEKIKLTDYDSTYIDSTYIKMSTNYYNNITNDRVSQIELNNGLAQSIWDVTNEDAEFLLSSGYNNTLVSQLGIIANSQYRYVYLQSDKISFAETDGFNYFGFDLTPIYPNDNYSIHPHKLYTPVMITGIYNDTLATLRNVRAGGGATIDTAAMLLPYLRKVDTTAMLSKYVNLNGYGLTKTNQTLSVDTSKISTLYQTNLKVPYVGATADVDLDTHKLSAQSLQVVGTNGNGHLDLKHQSSDAPATGQSTALFANSDGDLKYKNNGNYYTTLKTSLNTANRVYTYQNKSYTLGDSVDIEARVKYTDTASMLSKYINLANYGLTKTSQTIGVDTSKISTLYQTNLKVNISDTTAMLTPYLKKVDTTVFQRKSLAAYSFQANNTNATANATAQTFKDTSGTYTPGTTGTVTWGGTAPTSLSNGTFKYTQIGKMCTISITLLYGTSGTSATVDIVLPSFCATPDQPGFTSTNDFLYAGSGMMSTPGNNKTMSATSPNANRACYIKKNASGPPSMVITAAASGAVTFASGILTYYTN